jgi:hypothetical protein
MLVIYRESTCCLKSSKGARDCRLIQGTLPAAVLANQVVMPRMGELVGKPA